MVRGQTKSEKYIGLQLDPLLFWLGLGARNQSWILTRCVVEWEQSIWNKWCALESLEADLFTYGQFPVYVKGLQVPESSLINKYESLNLWIILSD